MRVCESTNQMSRWGVLLTNARSKQTVWFTPSV